MNILLTNDDGIEAEGIQAFKAALQRTMNVIVVAPETEQSECGHRVTTKRPLCVRQHAEREFSVDGSPADCVRIGLLELASDIDWVISGVNHGGNLGADIWMSGTVAAAREGFLRRCSAVAVSQVRKRGIADDWGRSADHALRAIEFAIGASHGASLWNVNIPAVEAIDIPEIVCCQPDPNPLPLSYRKSEDGYQFEADYHGRPRTPENDIDICFGGRISVSLLS